MLVSHLFRADPLLQKCAVDNAAHVLRGHAGDHVGRIQLALLALDNARIARDELIGSVFGASTATAVLSYKSSRGIINYSYQKHADDIVGIMTVARMDAELVALEGRLGSDKIPLTFAGLQDSAPVFLVRRVCVAALGGNGAPAQSLAAADNPDSAKIFRELLRSLRLQGAGNTQVGPEPGGLREKICVAGNSASQLQGAHWSNPGVKACWSVTLSEGSSGPSPTPDPVPSDLQWCGIFGTNIWSRGGAGVNWIFAKAPGGISNGPYLNGSRTRVMTSNRLAFVAPGDIVVEAYDSIHHVLILTVSADGRLATIVEGNAGSGGTNQTIVRTRSDYRLAEKQGRAYFYSVDSIRQPPVNYGDNIRGSLSTP